MTPDSQFAIDHSQLTIHPFFAPRGVAVIGASATPGKLGHGLIRNLRRSYRGHIYPVNPRAETILDLPCYPDVSAVPDPVDLALIIIPAPAVPNALRACGERGIRAAIILSGGFAESGREGAELQAEISKIGRAYGIRVIGPNCVGVQDTHSGLNATFLETMPDPGPIAFISQSGAVGGAMIDWAKAQGIGLSHFASLGNAADITEADLLAHLAADPHAGVFAVYIEGLDDGVKFMQTARRISPHKPIITLKAGGTEAGTRAVASHTAHLAGSDAAYAAAFKQSGIIQAETSADLFGYALALAYQPPPGGDRIAILTNAGGPGALAADALTFAGLQAPEPDAATAAALAAALGPGPQLANPIDLLGAASSPEFETAARILLASSSYDAILAILVPNAVNDPPGIADALHRAQAASDKPVYACYMGGASIAAGLQRLHEHNIPPYLFPESAARALAAAHAWDSWRQSQQQLSGSTDPTDPAPPLLPDLPPGSALDSYDLQQRLHTAGFPLPATRLARSSAEAAAFARDLARPVALKIASPDILHKTDSGGIRLNLSSAAVADAYENLLAAVGVAQPAARIDGVIIQEMAAPGLEVIIGARRDPAFGPLILFGGGGIYVESLKDVSFRIAPLTLIDARAMIAETVIGRLLAGTRGQPPADIDALAELIVRVADMFAATPAFAEFEFNPVIVHPAGRGVTAVDARAILGGK